MTLENILPQEMIQRLGWALVHFVWQATAVALLLAILLAALRKATSNVRYIVSCAALGLIVLLPIATMSLVPVSTPQPIVDIEPLPVPVIVQMEPANVETSVTKVVEFEEPVQVESIEAALKIPWKERVIAKLEASHPYLVAGWLIGVFGLSLWHLGGWAQLQRLKRHMVKPVEASLQDKLDVLAERLRISRAVRLVESALVQVPTVVGWLRPVILLPVSALTGLNGEQLEALLAHELAHIRRYDYLVNIFQTAVETLGFYHPAVWWVSHKIRTERENCCDDLAVGICGDRIRYARALASMEEIRARRNELAVAATGGNLFGRIHRLVGKNASDGSRIGWIPSVITILLIAIITIPTSIAFNANLRIKDQKRSIAPNKVVLKLVDPNSQPVVRARVGTSMEWSDTFKNPPNCFLRDGGRTRVTKVKSNKYGKITLQEEDLFWSVPPTLQKAPITAIDKGHSFAALHELPREDLGTEVTLTLQAACRVHGRLNNAAARKRQLSPNNLNVWVYWRVHTLCRNASKQGRFDFILPPGEYKLRFFSGNPNNSFTLPVRIKPGQRDLDLTGYLDGTQKLPETKIHGQDREGSIDSNKVVLKLIDPNSQPVVGAWVGTSVDWSDIAESPPIWYLKDGSSYKASEIDSSAKVISNKEGKITLTEDELFKPFWPSEVTVPLTAIDEGHYLAGLRELSREDLGTEVTLTLQPGCRVRGRVTAATARKHKWSTKVLTVYVYWRTHSPCQYISKEGRFEFILPPGRYEVRIYAEDSDKDVVFPIRIKPGQRELDMTKYLDGTSEPSNAEKNDSSTKVLIEAQTIHVTDEFLEQVGLDAKSLTSSDSWTQYRVDDSSNPTMFVIDSQTKEMFQKNIDESEGSSPISRIFLMAMSGREAMIKNYSGYDFKSQELGVFIKIKPTISQDCQSTYLDCELMTRQFENFKLFSDVYINKKVKQNDVSESEIAEYQVNAENALLSDDHTLLILGGKQVSLRDAENPTPILRSIPVIDKLYNTPSQIEGQKNEIILIKTTIFPPERDDDIGSKASSYNVAKMVSSEAKELLRIYLDLHLEAGQYVEIKDSNQREPIIKQVDTSSIGKSAKDFPAYASYIDFEFRSNVDLNLATQRFTRNSFFEHDKWDAYFTGPDTIIGNGHFSPTTLCISAWRAKLWLSRTDDIKPNLVAVIITPNNKPQESSNEGEKVDPNSWQEKFHSLYRLEDGQVLRRMAPPFIPERRDYFLSIRKGRYSPNMPEHVVRLYFNWDGKLSIRSSSAGGGITRLDSILRSVIGFGKTEYNIPPELLYIDMSGDWIVRKDTSQEELLRALEQIIKEEAGKEIHFVKREEVDSEVVVARGTYRFTPLPNAQKKDAVHVFTDKMDTYQGAGGGSGTLNKFLQFIGNHRINRNIIDKTDSSDVRLSWRNHYSSDMSWLEPYQQQHNEKVDMLLSNLARQTGLTFETETTTVEKWFVAEQGRIQIPQKADAKSSRLVSNTIPLHAGRNTNASAEKEKRFEPSAEFILEKMLQHPPRDRNFQYFADTGALPTGWSLKYIEDSDIGGNRAVLTAIPKPIDANDESWKQERLEFRISSPEGKLADTISFRERLQRHQVDVEPDKYVLKYERRWGDSGDNFRIWREFPVDLNRCGIYELQFIPRLGTAEITGARGGCYAVNFEKADQGPEICGFAYRNAGKGYRFDGLPPGTYKLSAVTQRQSDNVFISQAEVTISAEEKTTVNIASPPRGSCSLKGRLLGKQRKYQAPWQSSPESPGRWFVLIRRFGCGPIEKTKAYEALTMDSLYVVRGRNIVQETKDQALYHIEGMVPGRYTVTAIEHPWWNGCTITRQQSKTLVLKDGENAVLDFDLIDIPKDDTPMAVETERPIEKLRQGIESDKVVLKLVDPNSRPVVSARVGTYVDWSDMAENPPIWFLRDGRTYRAVDVESDEHGKVTLEAEDLFRPEWSADRKAPLTAIDAGHYFAGLQELSREDLGKEITLMLQPGCRVRGRVSAATARKRKWSTKTLTVYVDWGEYRPCQYTSKRGRFEFVLPEGTYNLKIYAEDPDEAVILPIQIKPGQRNLDLTKYLDGTSKLPAADTELSPEFILEKMREHRSRVKNLQYIAEDVIWRDPAAEKVLIEEHIKRMREKGIRERQLERWREQMSQIPETRYQILKCTVDDAGHTKIELTTGTFDSSGKKVPREEKHVWAWNGVLETEFTQRDGSPGRAIFKDKPNISITLGHPWRSFTGIFCGFLEETIKAARPVSVEELKDGTYRVGFDYKTSRYVAIVDPSMGYTCSLRETYNKQGQLNSRTTAIYEEVAEGIWFPVSGQREDYTAVGSLYHKSTAKSAQIRINDPSFDAGYFDVDIPKGAHVRDLAQDAEQPEVYRYGEPRITSVEDHNETIETKTIVERDEGRIEGRIIDIHTGKGIAGVRLTAVLRSSSASEKQHLCTSGEDGAFSFSGLQSGEYLIRGDFPSVDVAIASGQNIRDVLIGVDRRNLLQAQKDTTKEQQADVKIMIGLKVIAMPAEVMKEAFEPNESLPSELLIRNGHEITDRLLTLIDDRKDAKLMMNPQVLMRNNKTASVSSMENKMFISGYEPIEGEPNKLTPQHKTLDGGFKYTFHAGILEDGKKVHIELASWCQELAFETRQYRPGYDIQIPYPPDIFATVMTAKNSEPVVIGRVRRDESAFCLIVTPSVILPEPKPESLLGKTLPEPVNMEVLKQIGKRRILFCFWDMNQRPSRNMITELAKRSKELQAKGIFPVLVHTSLIEPAKLNEWLDNREILFPYYSETKAISSQELSRWGVRARPWLILTDLKGIVQAEGPSIEQLNEILREEIASNQVVLKLVDPNSQPVVGARVGTYVDWSDIAENPPIWFLRDGRSYKAVDVESDEHGKVVLDAEDLFRPEYQAERKVPLMAIDAGHYLAGLCELSREDMGTEVTLTLQPGCRVCGRVSTATARKRKWSKKTLTVYVDWGEYRPCQYTSKRGLFEFVLPEGTYKLKIYAEDPDGAVILPIQIKPGQRNLDLTKYLDGTSKLPAADTELSPEFILEKMLEHRSRVKNLQYIAEDVIWRDPAAEKVLIEEHIKRMREKGMRERQLERWREQMSQIPETRYQILKCTVDDAGHTKIELTTGTFASSGKKVPREEKHVWAWNGVLETEFTQRVGSPGSAIFKDKPNISITLGHPWRSFTGIFCGFLEETIKAERPVSVEELKDGTYRVGFDYKTSRYVAIVDPSKGYTCSLRETYNKQGQLNSRTTAIYEEVAEGIWFPVSGQREDYTAEGSLYHKSTAKSAQIRINDPAFNAGYFDVDIPKGAHMRDLTQDAEQPEVYRYGEQSKSPIETDVPAPLIGNPVGEHALLFDGINDCLHVPASPTLAMKPPFTIEMWIKPDLSEVKQMKASGEKLVGLTLIRKGKKLHDEGKIQAGGFAMVVHPSSKQENSCSGSLYLGMEGGRLVQEDAFDGKRSESGQPEWIHVSMSSRRSEMYVPVPDEPLVIGEAIRPPNLSPFKGQIAEVRIWNKRFTHSDPNPYVHTSLTGNEPNLVACWDFERTEGQMVYDISPNGNHAYLGKSKETDDADPIWINPDANPLQDNQKTNVKDNGKETGSDKTFEISKSTTNEPHVVKVDLSVVEVSSDSKIDKGTTVEIRNLLGDQITILDSPVAADLLKKAAKATGVIKNESTGDKQVTQQQFQILFDLMASRGYLKILMKPMIEVVEEKTANIISSQHIRGIKEPLKDSVQITPNVLESGTIVLNAKATFHQLSFGPSNEQTPIVNTFEKGTLLHLCPGESGIMSLKLQTAEKDLVEPAPEMLVILTPHILEKPKQFPSLVGKELPGFEDFETAGRPEDFKNRKILLCFWDMNQRPSRNMITELVKRSKEIQAKGIFPLLVHTSLVEPAKLNEWLDNHEILFSYYSKTEAISPQELFRWGVRALPWLILVDEEGIVQVEGPSIEQLDEILREEIASNQVVLKLVDPNSQPVVGARVGTYVDWSDIAENPPIWFLRDGRTYKAVDVESDEHGKVVLNAEDLFRPEWRTERKVPLMAIDAGHYLAGLRELSQEDLGTEVTLTLQPGCRICGRLSAAIARKRKWSAKTLTVYVDWREHRPCQYSSKQGQFEFILPPGTYKVMVYSDDPDKAVNLSIRIEPGQRDLDLTTYLDGTSKLSDVNSNLKIDPPATKEYEVVQLSYVNAEETLDRINATASSENMSRIAKQIVEQDDFQIFKPRIVKLQNSDPVQTAELLTTLFAEEDEDGMNIRDVILGENAEEKYNMTQPLCDHFTFEEVPGTPKMIVISNIPKAYDSVEQWIVELDKQNMAGKDVNEVREWMAGLGGGARLKSPKNIDNAEQSSHRMKVFGLALAMYADEHNDTLADMLSQIKLYIQEEPDFNWILENVEYFGKEKRTGQQNATHTPIAYDRTMLDEGVETNVLFLDFSVRRLDRKKLNELGIYPQAIKRALSSPTSEFDRQVEESAERLKWIGRALLIYANDHDGKYPECRKLHELREYFKDEEFIWLQQPGYLGGGRTITDRADLVIYHDINLIKFGKGTNVLFNDGHVEFANPKRLNDLNINKTNILIEIKILTAGDAFMKHIGLDPNSSAYLKGWSDYRVHTSGDSTSFIIDPLHADLLIKTTMAHKDAAMFAGPQLCAADGRQATIQIYDTYAYSLIPPDIEPNNPSGKTGSIPESIKLGTFIRLEPDALPDGNTVNLDFEWEYRRFLGFKKQSGQDQKTQKIPQIAVDKIATSYPIPDGKTLLITGKKITEPKKTRGKIQLADLPLIGGLFHKPTKPVETRNLLILIKPVINPPRKAQSPPKFEAAPPFAPDDPLIRKLEAKLKD